MSTTTDDLLALIAEILEIPGSSVALDSNLEELGWDSLSDLSFISAADERYSATVDPGQLAESETAADLLALVGN